MHSSSTKFRVSINTIIDLFKKIVGLQQTLINVGHVEQSIQISVHLNHNLITEIKTTP